MQKGFVPILIIITLVIIVGSAFYIQKNHNQKKLERAGGPEGFVRSEELLSKEIKNNETANNITYTNEEYGFSLDIPSIMNVIEEGLTSAKIGPNWRISWTNTSKEKSAKGESDYSMIVEVTFNPKNIKGEAITANNLDTLYINNDPAFEVAKITIQTRPAVRITNKDIENPSIQYYVLGKDTLFRLVGDSKDSNLFNYADINKILSTFKFIDQVSPTSVEGKACGGFLGEKGDRACPEGYYCKYPQPVYPDASGKCVKR